MLIGATRCDDMYENTIFPENQGPFGSVRKCSASTVTDYTSAQVKVSQEPRPCLPPTHGPLRLGRPQSHVSGLHCFEDSLNMLIHHTALSKLHHHLSKRSRPELPWARLLHYLFRFRFLRPTVKRSCRRSSPKFLCFAGLRSFGFMPRSSAPADRPTAAMSLGPGSAASATASHALDQFGRWMRAFPCDPFDRGTLRLNPLRVIFVNINCNQ